MNMNKGVVAGSVFLGQKTSFRKTSKMHDLHKTNAEANDTCTSKNKKPKILLSFEDLLAILYIFL